MLAALGFNDDDDDIEQIPTMDLPGRSLIPPIKPKSFGEPNLSRYAAEAANLNELGLRGASQNFAATEQAKRVLAMTSQAWNEMTTTHNADYAPFGRRTPGSFTPGAYKIPGYSGFLPGLTSEALFSGTIQKVGMQADNVRARNTTAPMRKSVSSSSLRSQGRLSARDLNRANHLQSTQSFHRKIVSARVPDVSQLSYGL